MTDYALDRVLTFSHNTMPAASLPLELQQEIFSYLDSRSFHAARKVCRWWRLASSDSTTLRRQLEKLPIQHSIDPRDTQPQDLQRLYNQAARNLLLGIRINERQRDGARLSYKVRHGLFPRPKIAAVSRGSKTVTINGGWLALFNTAEDPPEVLVQRPIHSTIEGARQIPWLNIAPAASFALALSSNGQLLAVAQERTIHIYDLSAGVEAEPVSRMVASAAGHYIQGLDFEQHDRMLRVQLSGKGVVLYLGTPSVFAQTTDFEYWESKQGLSHTFLDSSLLQLSQVIAAQQFQARLGGLQLLRPFGDGFLFAAQKHGGDESSHYIYGHVKCSQPAEGLPIAVEPGSITELARLESFLSVWDAVKDKTDAGMGKWEDMPCAHEHHPKFALSEDGGLLLLAEREKKHIRHVKWTQVFLYGIPSMRTVERLLREGEVRTQVRWKRLAKFMSGYGEDEHGSASVEGEQQKPLVARLPMSVGAFEGEATEVRFDAKGVPAEGTMGFVVATEEQQRSWQLVET